jgi:hypothetical protein
MNLDLSRFDIHHPEFYCHIRMTEKGNDRHVKLFISRQGKLFTPSQPVC